MTLATPVLDEEPPEAGKDDVQLLKLSQRLGRALLQGREVTVILHLQ